MATRRETEDEASCPARHLPDRITPEITTSIRTSPQQLEECFDLWGFRGRGMGSCSGRLGGRWTGDSASWPLIRCRVQWATIHASRVVRSTRSTYSLVSRVPFLCLLRLKRKALVRVAPVLSSSPPAAPSALRRVFPPVGVRPCWPPFPHPHCRRGKSKHDCWGCERSHGQQPPPPLPLPITSAYPPQGANLTGPFA